MLVRNLTGGFRALFWYCRSSSPLWWPLSPLSLSTRRWVMPPEDTCRWTTWVTAHSDTRFPVYIWAEPYPPCLPSAAFPCTTRWFTRPVTALNPCTNPSSSTDTKSFTKCLPNISSFCRSVTLSYRFFQRYAAHCFFKMNCWNKWNYQKYDFKASTHYLQYSMYLFQKQKQKTNKWLVHFTNYVQTTRPEFIFYSRLWNITQPDLIESNLNTWDLTGSVFLVIKT